MYTVMLLGKDHESRFIVCADRIFLPVCTGFRNNLIFLEIMSLIRSPTLMNIANMNS